MDQILINIIMAIVFGFVTGLVTSTIVTSRVLLTSASRARYRVRETIKATKEIFDKSKNPGRTRNRHRYSLAVIIDTFERTWKDGFKEYMWPPLVHIGEQEGRPCLVNQQQKPDLNADRWELFNQYVRPVIEETEPFSYLSKHHSRFLSLSTYFSPIKESHQQIHQEMLQLDALIKLCNHLEDVVAELDAAFEKKNLVDLTKLNDGNIVITPTGDAINSESKVIEQLKNKYHDLHTAWLNWLRVL